MKRVAPVILLAAIAISAHAQPIRYQIGAVIEFPQEGYSTGLSNAGHIVGNLSPELQGFLWKDGAMSLLPPLNGGRFTSASRVNASGQAVGYSQHSSPGVHAALWTDGVPLDLGTLGGRDSGGLSINEAGVAVGYSYIGSGNGMFEDYRAFIYKDGVMTDLGTLGTFDTSAAVAINNHGVVVGNLHREHSGDSSFIWDEQNGMRYITQDQGSGVRDIIDTGHILFDWRIVNPDGSQIQLPRFFSADEMTIGGWVGGGFSDLRYAPGLYVDGSAYLVSDLILDDLMGWELKSFQGINDSAQMIVGAQRGNEFATILLNPVPEPSTLIAVGALLAICIRKRKFRMLRWLSTANNRS